ncbi:hypothetical protein FPCIR_3262 [Fusarium pseudocircinatum]|uniref:Uncharacterized protein n=1 Tax=Fusarium pseudocircinatum TaxID=56676 RepID=A0A8H5PJS1_9HYPO|nr:hypothetical protein FPCIR_3262 [Fusarium pseudocircinatum]
MSDDVITDDFDVEVFLDLLHWSWEDAYKGTREPECPVSPFSQPVRPLSERGVPPTEPTMSQPEREGDEEQSLSLGSRVYSSCEDLVALDRDESLGTIRSATLSPASCSHSGGQSSPSTINGDNSPRAQASNLKRSASSDTDAPVPKRICRRVRNGLMSVTDAELNSTAEPPKSWKASCDHPLASCGHDSDLHKNFVADFHDDKEPEASYWDIVLRRKDYTTPEPNVSSRKYR